MEDIEILDAYFETYGPHADQPANGVHWVKESDGTEYALLVNVNGLLAIYGPDGFIEFDAAHVEDMVETLPPNLLEAIAHTAIKSAILEAQGITEWPEDF